MIYIFLIFLFFKGFFFFSGFFICVWSIELLGCFWFVFINIDLFIFFFISFFEFLGFINSFFFWIGNRGFWVLLILFCIYVFFFVFLEFEDLYNRDCFLILLLIVERLKLFKLFKNFLLLNCLLFVLIFCKDFFFNFSFVFSLFW